MESINQTISSTQCHGVVNFPIVSYRWYCVARWTWEPVTKDVEDTNAMAHIMMRLLCYIVFIVVVIICAVLLVTSAHRGQTVTIVLCLICVSVHPSFCQSVHLSHIFWCKLYRKIYWTDLLQFSSMQDPFEYYFWGYSMICSDAHFSW